MISDIFICPALKLTISKSLFFQLEIFITRIIHKSTFQRLTINADRINASGDEQETRILERFEYKVATVHSASYCQSCPIFISGDQSDSKRVKRHQTRENGRGQVGKAASLLAKRLNIIGSCL